MLSGLGELVRVFRAANVEGEKSIKLADIGDMLAGDIHLGGDFD